jgi:TonB-dependent SusC/RagA subfamily outer membrane receptor
MKKNKTFSIAITMLICYVSFGQEKLNLKQDSTKIVQVKTHCLSSIRNDNKPLFILDEKIASEKVLKNIDPNSIASVNVLKDKAATALYGSQAKYGVIIIETKEYQKAKNINQKTENYENN